MSQATTIWMGGTRWLWRLSLALLLKGGGDYYEEEPLLGPHDKREQGEHESKQRWEGIRHDWSDVIQRTVKGCHLLFFDVGYL